MREKLALEKQHRFHNICLRWYVHSECIRHVNVRLKKNTLKTCTFVYTCTYLHYYNISTCRWCHIPVICLLAFSKTATVLVNMPFCWLYKCRCSMRKIIYQHHGYHSDSHYRWLPFHRSYFAKLLIGQVIDVHAVAILVQKYPFFSCFVPFCFLSGFFCHFYYHLV